LKRPKVLGEDLQGKEGFKQAKARAKTKYRDPSLSSG
jgi:hypothetical protein